MSARRPSRPSALSSGLLLPLRAGTALAQAEPLVLKTEYQDTQPKYIRHADGSFSGLCVELLERIGQVADIRFEQPGDFVPRRRIEHNLGTGQIDLHCGLRKPPRITPGSGPGFSEPLYRVAHMVVGRQDESLHIDSIGELRALKDDPAVLAVFGTSTAHALKRQLERVDDTARTVEVNFRKLISGRGRVFVHYDLALAYALRQSPLAAQLRVVGSDLQPYNHYLVYSPHLPAATRTRIDTAIHNLKANGEWAALLARYPVKLP